MRNYFVTKAKLSEDLEDAFDSLAGLKATSDKNPFVNVWLSG